MRRLAPAALQLAYLLVECRDLLVELAQHLGLGVGLVGSRGSDALLGLNRGRSGGHGHAAALRERGLALAFALLGTHAPRLLGGVALALERRDLVAQPLKLGTLLAQFGAENAQALVTGPDFIVLLHTVGMPDQADATLVNRRFLGQTSFLITAMVDDLWHNARRRGRGCQMPVGDFRPGLAHLVHLLAAHGVGALPLPAVHLHWPLAGPILGAKPLGLGLLHGPALAVLEVVQLLPPRGLGRLPLRRADGHTVPVFVLAEVEALARLVLGFLHETVCFKVERGHQYMRVWVAAMGAVVDRPVAGLRGEQGAEVPHAGAAPVLVELDRQREFVAFRDERLAAAALDPDALGLVPELAAAHGRDAGGKGKALVQDAFLSGVVADLARALLYECLA